MTRGLGNFYQGLIARGKISQSTLALRVTSKPIHLAVGTETIEGLSSDSMRGRESMVLGLESNID
jgi:hypothetical protein